MHRIASLKAAWPWPVIPRETAAAAIAVTALALMAVGTAVDAMPTLAGLSGHDASRPASVQTAGP